MASDNISETSASGPKLVFLAPGMVIQWWKFMFVGDLKTYGGVRQQTRLARSELMTWVYSIIFWLVVLGIGFVGLADRYLPDGNGQALTQGALMTVDETHQWVFSGPDWRKAAWEASGCPEQVDRGWAADPNKRADFYRVVRTDVKLSCGAR